MTTDGIEGCERFLSPGKGRGVRATKTFEVGDLVFTCPAYSYVLSTSERSSRCDFCFTRTEGLSKCGRCKQAYYCNVECQEGDWPMHKVECSAMCSYGQNWCPSETVRLVARILQKQKLQANSVGRSPSERLLSLKEFESHLDEMDNEKNKINQIDVSALHHFYSKCLDMPSNTALVELFSQNYSPKVNCNGFTIEDEELSHLGSAVFPDVALMNHSCNPNVIVTYKGTVAEVRAIQKISAEEEIFNSYIDLLYSTADRTERLKDSYFFTCYCTECTTKLKDNAKLKIREGLSTSPEEIQDMLRYARKIIEEFRKAKHHKTPSELLEICEISLEKMGSIFDETHVYTLHMMYQAMGVCLYMQDWEGAVKYGEKIVEPYSVHYPQYSLNVASMYLKLGRLYLGLEKKSQGVNTLKKALAIMIVVFGEDNHYISALKKEIEDQK